MKIDLTNKHLALNGGTPLRSEHKKWQDNFTTGEEEKAAASEVIESGYLSLFEGSHTPDVPFSFEGGPYVQKFESEWSAYYNVKHSISVNSATSGLFAAIGALGIGYGDEVIVSPYTMTACALAPLIYGAIPVFADVELETGSLDPTSIRAKVSKNTKAIIVVHQFGIPANMDKISAIAKEFNLKIIEDCAQAHGCLYKGKEVGTIGDIGVFSLNVNKTIQTGEGGVCVTNDDDLAYRLKLIRNHGEAVVGPAGYKNIVNIAGFNYRMTEILAAVASVQLKKLPALNTARIAMVSSLVEQLSEFDFLQPLISRPECKNCTCAQNKKCKPTFYVFPMRFLPEKTNITRKEFIATLNAEGFLFFQGYVAPLYLQPLYQEKSLFRKGYPFEAPANQKLNMDYAKGLCPTTERLHYHEMTINEHIRLPNTQEDIDDIYRAIKKIIQH
jgi:perosamine synthetase